MLAGFYLLRGALRAASFRSSPPIRGASAATSSSTAAAGAAVRWRWSRCSCTSRCRSATRRSTTRSAHVRARRELQPDEWFETPKPMLVDAAAPGGADGSRMVRRGRARRRSERVEPIAVIADPHYPRHRLPPRRRLRRRRRVPHACRHRRIDAGLQRELRARCRRCSTTSSRAASGWSSLLGDLTDDGQAATMRAASRCSTATASGTACASSRPRATTTSTPSTAATRASASSTPTAATRSSPAIRPRPPARSVGARRHPRDVLRRLRGRARRDGGLRLLPPPGAPALGEPVRRRRRARRPQLRDPLGRRRHGAADDRRLLPRRAGRAASGSCRSTPTSSSRGTATSIRPPRPATSTAPTPAGTRWCGCKPFLLDWMADVAARARAGGKRLLAFSHYPCLDLLGATQPTRSRSSARPASCAGRRRRRPPARWRATGIGVHFSGHLHVNDTTLWRDGARQPRQRRGPLDRRLPAGLQDRHLRERGAPRPKRRARRGARPRPRLRRLPRARSTAPAAGTPR